MTLGCPNDSTYSKNWVWRQTIVLACSEPKLQFHSLKLSLASYYPSTLFLSFRSIWGSWKWSQLITHTQKHWVWHQNQVYQSNNFTPWSCSWPPSAPPPCSWPSDQSEALVNGPKWFSIPKNHGLDTKLVSSMNWSKVTIYAILAQNTHFRPTFAIFQGIGTWGLTTSYVKNFEFLLISTYQSTF